jgi:hypothetical protein
MDEVLVRAQRESSEVVEPVGTLSAILKYPAEDGISHCWEIVYIDPWHGGEG